MVHLKPLILLSLITLYHGALASPIASPDDAAAPAAQAEGTNNPPPGLGTSHRFDPYNYGGPRPVGVPYNPYDYTPGRPVGVEYNPYDYRPYPPALTGLLGKRGEMVAPACCYLGDPGVECHHLPNCCTAADRPPC